MKQPSDLVGSWAPGNIKFTWQKYITCDKPFHLFLLISRVCQCKGIYFFFRTKFVCLFGKHDLYTDMNSVCSLFSCIISH
jgi:hypothetical protein